MNSDDLIVLLNERRRLADKEALPVDLRIDSRKHLIDEIGKRQAEGRKVFHTEDQIETMRKEIRDLELEIAECIVMGTWA